MNNEQFRRLAFDNPKPAKGSPVQDASSADTPAGGRPRPQALGSKNRSSIPMTPRSVTGVNFAQQLAEHRRESQQPPTKKFKSSSAPKGSKLATGYQDRTLLRRFADEEQGGGGGGEEQESSQGDDDREQRLQALEEMVKLGQIDQTTFEKLRKDIGVGGDLGSTHLVKGLDFDLLRRVKEGDDVSAPSKKEPEEDGGSEEAQTLNTDEEFDRLVEEREKDVVQPVKKEANVKKGSMAPPPPPPSAGPAAGKMTRDEILKQLKASRAAGTAGVQVEKTPVSALGSRFKKVGEGGDKKRWVEEDKTGRRKEILLTTDSTGNTKRKARWLDPPVTAQQGKANNDLLSVDKGAQPLGMEVPADVLARMKTSEKDEEDEDNDIFQGVGTDYNPLADIGEASSSSDSETEDKTKPAEAQGLTEDGEVLSTSADRPTEEASGARAAAAPRNYFATGPGEHTSEPVENTNPLTSDPTILGALKRAAAIRKGSPSSETVDDDESRDGGAKGRHKKFLEEAKRREMQDEEDMDMGFGGSRYMDDDDDQPVLESRDASSNKRKRGPKKKKGNKESASDVMKVLEGRQKEEK